MLRPLRLFFRLAMAVSFVMFVALIMLWVRSYRAKSVAEFWWAGGRWDVTSAGGRAWLSNEPQRRLEQQPAEQAKRLYEAGAARYRTLLAQFRTPLSQRETGDDTMAVVRPDANTESSGEKLTRELDILGEYLSRAHASTRPSYMSFFLWSDSQPPPPPFTPPKLTAPIRHSWSYWLPTATAAVLPAVWLSGFVLARRRHRRRLASGVCVACGYDLRASPDLCPECGAAAPRRDDASVARV